MTISSETRKSGPFLGTGAVSEYPFNFTVFAGEDLELIMAVESGVEITLVLNSDYTVNLNSNQDSSPGGTVLLSAPLPSGYRLVITSKLANLQPTDLTNQGGFYPQVVTRSLDRLTIMIQQVSEKVGRAMKIPISRDSDASVLSSAVLRVAEWLNGTSPAALDATDISYGPPSIVATKTVAKKLLEIPSLTDFGNMTDFTAAVDGGIGVIPTGTHTISAFNITQPGHYLNASTERLSSDLLNVGEVVGKTTTRELTVDATAGTNIGKRRFTELKRLASAGAGSTIAIDGTGDYSRGTFAYKENYLGAAADGEIGGHYTAVRQGGASGSLNDCSAELYDVSTFSDSFACLTEGATTKVSGGSITDSVRVITGFLTKGTSDMGGIATIIQAGAASNIDYREVQAGASATNLFKYVNHNAADGRKDLFNITGNGNIKAVMRDNLGTVLGNNVIPLSLSVYNNNKDSVVTQLIRTSDGSDYVTAEWRFQRTIDQTTGGGLTFGYHPTRGHTASLCSGGSPLLTQTSNLYLGFNGATPITKPALNAAATDLATVVALTNQIRSALINYGLAT